MKSSFSIGNMKIDLGPGGISCMMYYKHLAILFFSFSKVLAGQIGHYNEKWPFYQEKHPVVAVLGRLQSLIFDVKIG